MTFTKEWLQHQIAEFESCAERTDGYRLDEGGKNTLAALKLALAGMEAEPVAWALIDPESGHSVSTKAEFTLNFYRDKGWNIAPLYAAPQPLTTSERAELENYRNAQQVGGPCGVRAKVNDGHHVGAGDGSYGRAGDDLSARGMGGSGCGNNALQQNLKCSCRACRQ